MLKAGVIRPSESNWGSPVMLVKKKSLDEKLCFRVVIDYRKLNAVTRPIAYTIPRLEDIVDAVEHAKPTRFTIMDLKSGYFQIPLKEGDSKQKSAFNTQNNKFEFNVASFGLQGLPAYFSKVMSSIFRGISYKYMVHYIDDLLVYSPDVQTHIQHLQTVFDRIRGANLRIHPQKSIFCTTRVVYLGHVFSSQGIAMDDSKIQAMVNYPRPTNVKSLRSLLGLINYYRRFIRGYSKVAAPLYSLLKRDAAFVWTEACENAFLTLRKALVSEPILAFPDMNKPFCLHTDGYGVSIAWILSQIGDDGNEHVILYGGRSLRANESSYASSELEALAVVEAIKANHIYLIQRPFTVVTDHHALQWLQKSQSQSPRLNRWGILLSSYRFGVKYRKGRDNHVDGLSRIEYKPLAVTPEEDVSNHDIYFSMLQEGTDECTESVSGCKIYSFEYESDIQYNINDHLSPLTSGNESCRGAINDPAIWVREQHLCRDVSRIIDYLENGNLPVDPKLARQTIIESEDYEIENDILFHLYRPPKNIDKIQPLLKQIVVSLKFREEILYEYHKNCNHNAVDKMFNTMRFKYYWPFLYSFIKTYAKLCSLSRC